MASGYNCRQLPQGYLSDELWFLLFKSVVLSVKKNRKHFYFNNYHYLCMLFQLKPETRNKKNDI
jgi:hypothetical protein